jgi:guanosine-3',5'-bis(diphosphate) 3'-pyrophosphohydrolase
MSIEQQGAERQAQAATQPSPPHGPEPSSSRPAREARARGSVAGRLRAGLPRPHSPETAFRHVQESVVGHYPQADVALLRQAFDFAQQAHRNQTRVTGEPYVTHPLAAAKILADIGIDPVAVTAAILHDVPEDTDFTLNDVEERFGAEVAQLVDGVTKLSKFSTHSHEEQQAENIRKMFLAMAEDIRVVLIKLADRLHNMRTLSALPIDKQHRIARQTMEIYAPLAERLGIWNIKWELEDLAFKTLEPERYRDLARMLDTRRRGREAFIRRAIDALRPELQRAGIEADLSGRPKHLYSIWKKMQRKGAELGEIYDVYAIRLLVEEIKDCYAALGVVHSIWRPIPGQFDDYIAVPKPNLYQSLHTAVIAMDGQPLEIQIRTHAMHQVSEVGIAAHWRYKDGSRADREYDAKLAWLRQVMDWQREVTDATEFVEGVKLDVFQDQVFVFTPKGEVKDLPAGATPLDFAYRIHTDVGHRCIGAKVNNRLVPLEYRLKNGDIVEIVTTKGEHGPSRDWLSLVRTSHAKEKIRQWFKRQERDENIVHGREALERELRRLARTSVGAVGQDRIMEIARAYNFESLDDFYAAIGYGAIGAQQVVTRLGVMDDAQLALPPTAAPVTPERQGGVRVKGVGDLLVRFGKCCHPIPGDPIIGFITRGKGVTVHQRSCQTVMGERETVRLVEVEWEGQIQQTYPISIRVEAFDRTGLLSDISQVLAEHKVNILAANVAVTADRTATVKATLEVSSVAQLAKVITRLEQLKDVITVSRDVS